MTSDETETSARDLRKRNLAEKVAKMKQKQVSHENYKNSSIGKADYAARNSIDNIITRIKDFIFTYIWPPPIATIPFVVVPLIFYVLKKIFYNS